MNNQYMFCTDGLFSSEVSVLRGIVLNHRDNVTCWADSIHEQHIEFSLLVYR